MNICDATTSMIQFDVSIFFPVTKNHLYIRLEMLRKETGWQRKI